MSGFLKKSTVEAVVSAAARECACEETNCAAYECGWLDACKLLLSRFEDMDGFSAEDIRAGKPDLIEAEARLGLAVKELAAARAVVERLKQHFEE